MKVVGYSETSGYLQLKQVTKTEEICFTKLNRLICDIIKDKSDQITYICYFFFQMKRKGHIVKEEPDSSPGKKFCRDGEYQR